MIKIPQADGRTNLPKYLAQPDMCDVFVPEHAAGMMPSSLCTPVQLMASNIDVDPCEIGQVKFKFNDDY